MVSKILHRNLSGNNLIRRAIFPFFHEFNKPVRSCLYCASQRRVLRRDKIAIKENIELARNDLKYASQNIQLCSHAVIINLITMKT